MHVGEAGDEPRGLGKLVQRFAVPSQASQRVAQFKMNCAQIMLRQITLLPQRRLEMRNRLGGAMLRRQQPAKIVTGDGVLRLQRDGLLIQSQRLTTLAVRGEEVRKIDARFNAVGLPPKRLAVFGGRARDIADKGSAADVPGSEAA